MGKAGLWGRRDLPRPDPCMIAVYPCGRVCAGLVGQATVGLDPGRPDECMIVASIDTNLTAGQMELLVGAAGPVPAEAAAVGPRSGPLDGLNLTGPALLSLARLDHFFAPVFPIPSSRSLPGLSLASPIPSFRSLPGLSPVSVAALRLFLSLAASSPSPPSTASPSPSLPFFSLT